MRLSDEEVFDFVLRKDASYQGRLKSYFNYSRVVALAHFERLADRFGLTQGRVAVVSGSEREPELCLIDPVEVKLFNFDTESGQFDLDKPWPDVGGGGFDLVLCNQVIEHIFSPHQAFQNLIALTKPGGYIFVTAPTVNGIHGEPYFYSAGYHPRMLERLGNEASLEVLDVGAWGSKKYLLNGVTCDWLTWRQLRRFSLMRQRFKIKVPIGFFSDGRTNSDQVITDTWALFRRPA